MKIVNIKDLEDCFDGTFIKELLFDEAVTKDFIQNLEKAGKLEYYPTFPKPFYKLDVPGKYILKGVEGHKTARIILNRKNIQEGLAHIECFIKNLSHLSQAETQGI